MELVGYIQITCIYVTEYIDLGLPCQDLEKRQKTTRKESNIQHIHPAASSSISMVHTAII